MLKLEETDMNQAERLSALLNGEDDPIATLANAATFLYQEIGRAHV